MPANPQKPPKSTSPSGSGSEQFADLISKFADPKNLPSKDKLAAMNAEIEDSFRELVKHMFLASTLVKARYDGLTKAGFTEEQAMRIITKDS